jgi:hypothetical protein
LSLYRFEGYIIVVILLNYMSKLSRHHHYIPQCYLRGFLPSGQKKPKLTVIDLKERRVFLTGTRGIGGIRDFNRIEADGILPDILENSLSSFEGQVATALKKIEEQHSLVDKQIFDIIINFIALLAIRHPQVRTNIANAQAGLTKMALAAILADKERYESTLRKARQKGEDIEEDIPYEQMKDFFDSEKYNIVVPNEFHIYIEFNSIKTILPFLFDRGWILLLADENAGPFITCDRPVILEWKHPENLPPFYRYSPGFGLKDTRIIFPVSKNMVMIGEFDIPNAVTLAKKRLVSVVNTKVIQFANPQVYAPDPSFSFINIEQKIRPGTDLLLRCKQ